MIKRKLLGKKAPRLDKRTFKLSNYLRPELPPPPVRTGYIAKVKSWPMFLNDELGNCVVAGMAHIEQLWKTYSGRPFLITNEDVLKGYEDIGGYVQGDPSTDNGCVMLDALKYWRKQGLAGNKIKAFVSVDKNNRKEVAQAIYLFGNLFAGLALPVTAQNPVQSVPGSTTPCWSMAGAPDATGDGSPGSWGGHAIMFHGYSNRTEDQERSGALAVSWGEVYDVTWPFFTTYVDELYAVLSEDWINAAGQSPAGFNLKQLEKDLCALR